VHTVSCPCTAAHSPRLTTTVGVNHHIVPKSWGGPSTPSNMIEICPTAHDLVHELLNHYVRAGAVPAWAVRRGYVALVRDLVEQAWQHRPLDRRPPLTSARRTNPMMTGRWPSEVGTSTVAMDDIALEPGPGPTDRRRPLTSGSEQAEPDKTKDD